MNINYKEFKKNSKGISVYFLIIFSFLYLIPGLAYTFVSHNTAFKILAIVFVFIQLILSDEFLENCKIFHHFNLVGQKESNYSRIQYYRILNTNFSISFLLCQLILPIITNISSKVRIWVKYEFPNDPPSIITMNHSSKAMQFIFLWIISLLFILPVLEIAEVKIANYMKGQKML